MHRTLAQVEAAYELLRTLPPFRGWHLPPGDDVEFHLTRHRDRVADHRFENGTHKIRISLCYDASVDDLLRVLAHEACHMRQAIVAPRDSSLHGRRFERHAAAVNKHHPAWEIGVHHVVHETDLC